MSFGDRCEGIALWAPQLLLEIAVDDDAGRHGIHTNVAVGVRGGYVARERATTPALLVP